MDERYLKEDAFGILRLVSQKESLTQREVSGQLGISLGKANYLLKALAKKGLIKVKNFSLKNKKIKKVRYILTGKGFEEKARLTYYFLKKTEKEYLRLKAESREIEVG